ncbi:hypothetical protein C3397_26385 [Enterobacter cloacae complex sp. ECNIH16]|uniref:Phage tail protein n=4 Tax=Enterobacteriaceae TaxID=543 RepID=A0ABD7KHI1_9ENTR|nr:hypothetical protein L402_02777 [Enterobacter asburiae]POV37198.1 hypothetical protein C3397_26385 [Enterobacter cloacae complex sp. ECNIH16]POV39637.1 hypothetical protein C3394_13795 [Enterobacter cloacae complex sp. ECNIH11]SAA13222.1 Uncharacterised protein [Enterobacter roggenkampii]SAC15944.1 Uncharacterised protein [Enterobacter roggenkampii]
MMPKIYKGILNMAFNSIFVGNNVKVEIATAPTGGGQATTFTVVEEVGAFPSAAGAESNVVSVNTFGQQYAKKLLGSRSVPDLTLTVNWKPGAVGQEMLAAAAAAQTLIQVKVTYFQKIDDQDGAAYYSIVNGYVSSDVVNGDFDGVVTRDFVVSVTGAPIAVGEVTGS